MSNFVKTFDFVTEFDGDTVTFVLRRLTRAQLMALTPLFGGTGTALSLVDGAVPVLQQVVVSMAGLKNASGQILELKDILEEGYFTQLFMDLINELVVRSSVRVLPEKKSVQESVESLAEVPKASSTT